MSRRKSFSWNVRRKIHAKGERNTYFWIMKYLAKINYERIRKEGKSNTRKCNAQIKCERTTLLVLRNMQIKITKIPFFIYEISKSAELGEKPVLAKLWRNRSYSTLLASGLCQLMGSLSPCHLTLENQSDRKRGAYHRSVGSGRKLQKPGCPSVGQQFKQAQYAHTVYSFSVIKNTELDKHRLTRRNVCCTHVLNE